MNFTTISRSSIGSSMRRMVGVLPSIVGMTTTMIGLVTFILIIPSTCGMTSNPSQKYAAVSYKTNDRAANAFYRQVDEVYASFVFGGDADPTEETPEGYTIVYNRNQKRYEYARLNPTTGDLVPSGVLVVKGMEPPKDKVPKKHLRRTPAGVQSIAMNPVAIQEVSGSDAGLMAILDGTESQPLTTTSVMGQSPLVDSNIGTASIGTTTNETSSSTEEGDAGTLFFESTPFVITSSESGAVGPMGSLGGGPGMPPLDDDIDMNVTYLDPNITLSSSNSRSSNNMAQLNDAIDIPTPPPGYYDPNITYYYGDDTFVDITYYDDDFISDVNVTYNDTNTTFDDVTKSSRQLLMGTQVSLKREKNGNPEKELTFDDEVRRAHDLATKEATADSSRQRNLQQHNLPAGNSNIKCLVVPMKFSNHASRSVPAISQIQQIFNFNGIQGNLAPTGSLKSIFSQLSHNHLAFSATVVEWITLSQNEQFYAGGKRGYDVTKMHQAFTEALNYLETTVKFDFRPFDSNADGVLDCVLFMHSGYSAEFGGISEDNAYFMDRIWSHTGTMTDSTTGGWRSPSKNKRVQHYSIASIHHGTHPDMHQSSLKDKLVRVGVIAHELVKLLGLTIPLSESQNLGSWSIASGQSNPWGFSGDQYCIPSLDPLVKLKKKWFPSIEGTAKEIKKADSNGKLIWIRPSYALDSTGTTAIIIRDGFRHPTEEYLLLEYRKRGTSALQDGCLPNIARYTDSLFDGGLLVWHIDESTFGQNQKRVVGLIAADGNTDQLLGRTNSGDGGDLFHPLGVDYLGPGLYYKDSKTGAIPFPNTDSYRGYSTGITLKDIEFRNNQLLVRVVWEDDPATIPSPVAPPVRAPTKSPTVAPVRPTRVRIPTLSPTRYTAAPYSKELYNNEASIFDTCSSPNDAMFVMELITDLKGHETTWMLVDAQRGNTLKQKGGPYPKGISQVYRYSQCLPKATCWIWTIEDSGGNGIDRRGSPKGAGYKLWWDGKLITQTLPTASGKSPSFVETGYPFGSACGFNHQKAEGGLNTSNFGLPEQNSPENLDENLVIGSGIMFDIHFHSQHGRNDFRNSGKSIVFKRFNGLHMTQPPHPMAANAPINIKIYTKRGTYQGYETSASNWDKVLDQNIRLTNKQGLFEWTYMSNIDPWQVMRSGSTQAFYIVTNPPVLAMLDCSKDMQVDGKPSQLWPTGQDKHFNALSGLLMNGNFNVNTSVKTVCPDTTLQYSFQMIDGPATDTGGGGGGTGGDVGCRAGEEKFTLDITIPKTRQGDITWTIDDIVAKKFRMDNPIYVGSTQTKFTHSQCLPKDNGACYKFTIRDKTGQGIDHKATYGNFLVHERVSSLDNFGFAARGGEFGGSGCRGAQLANRDTLNFGKNTPLRNVNGIMFDLKANAGQDVTIMKMSAFLLEALTGGGTHRVRIWTKNGSYKGYESDASVWTNVLDSQIPGAGPDNLTWQQGLGSFKENVVMTQYTVQSFYLLVNTGNKIYVQNIPDKTPGSPYKSFGKLDAYVGVGCNSSAPFVGCNSATAPSVGLLGALTAGLLQINNSATYSPTRAPFSPTPYPTYKWEPTPAPTPRVRDIFCSGGTKPLKITLDTSKANASNLSWFMEDISNKYPVVDKMTSPSYIRNKPASQTHQYCLPHAEACYRFVLRDSTSQGTFHKVTYDGKVVSEWQQGQAAPKPYRSSGGDFGGACQTYDESTTQVLNVGHDGANRSNGMMFDIVTKPGQPKAINLYRFASMHLTNTVHHVQIYTKNGSYQGYETNADAWTLVFDNQSVRGTGKNNVAWQAENLLQKATIAQETIQGFYILIKTGLTGLFYQTKPLTNVGEVFKDMGSFLLLTGVPCSSTDAFAKGSCDKSSDAAGFNGHLSVYQLPIRDNYVSRPTPVATPVAAPVKVPAPAPVAPVPVKVPVSAPVPVPVPVKVPAPVPVAAPVPVPTTGGGACKTNEGILDITINPETSQRASKIRWIVEDVVSASYREVSPAYSTTTIKTQLCIPPSSTVDACYRFALYDDATGVTTGTVHSVKYNGIVISEVKAGAGVPYYSTMGGVFGSDQVCQALPVEGRGGNFIALSGQNRASGIMFDIQAREGIHANLYRMQGFHLLEGGPYNIKIYTKQGTYKGYETTPGAWELILDAKNIQGAGQGSFVMQNSNLIKNIPILADTTQALYVLVQGGSGTTAHPMFFTYDANIGSIYQTTSKFHIKVGSACSSATPFTNCNVGIGAKYDGTMLAGLVNVVKTFAPVAAPVPVAQPVRVPVPAPVPVKAPAPVPVKAPVPVPVPVKAPVPVPVPVKAPVPVPVPVKAPVPVPTAPVAVPTATGGCKSNEDLLDISITAETATRASKLRWIVEDVVSASYRQVSPKYSTTSASIKKQLCIPQNTNACYRFVLYDDTTGATTGTVHKVTYNGKVISEIKSNAGAPYYPSMGGHFATNEDVCLRLPVAGRTGFSIARSGQNRASGIMFDIQALKGIQLNVYRMHGFHLLDGGTYNIKIYTKMGTYKGYETSSGDWDLIVDLKGITGMGQNSWTMKQTNFNTNVPILAETTQAFYVLVQGGTGTTAHPLYFSYNANVGSVYSTTDRFVVKTGTACSSPQAFTNCNVGIGAQYDGLLMAGFVETQ